MIARKLYPSLTVGQLWKGDPTTGFRCIRIQGVGEKPLRKGITIEDLTYAVGQRSVLLESHLRRDYHVEVSR